MKADEYYLVVFDSTHYAIRAESLFKQEGLECEMIPTPREIDSSCGLSIKFTGNIFEKFREIINVKENRIRTYKGKIVKGRTVYTEQEM